MAKNVQLKEKLDTYRYGQDHKNVAQALYTTIR